MASHVVRRWLCLRLALALGALALSTASFGQASPLPVRAAIRQTALVSNVPSGAMKLRVWLALPREERAQKVEELKLTGGSRREVSAPGDSGSRTAYFEVDSPKAQEALTAEYIFERLPVVQVESPDAAARMTESVNERSIRFYANELKAEPGIPLGGALAGLAKVIVQGEQNPVRQAQLLYTWVTANIRPAPLTQPRPPTAGAEECFKDRVGSSFEMHALFASLARSLQLPVRLVLGRELEPLAGMQRWWAEFQALGIGWVPVDVYSGADLTSRERPRLFGRLDALRMSLAVGREAKLAPKPAAASISGFVDLYAEVDGKPHGSYRSTFVAAPARSKDP